MSFRVIHFIVAILAVCSVEARAQDKAPDPDRGKTLFITYGCGWCHEDGGRRAAKCPQLMNTTRDDDYIVNRIATGKLGGMPAFGGALSLEQIDDLVAYIHSLKPDT